MITFTLLQYITIDQAEGGNHKHHSLMIDTLRGFKGSEHVVIGKALSSPSFAHRHMELCASLCCVLSVQLY